jgi:fluoroacetyl-CoA thioesterase
MKRRAKPKPPAKKLAKHPSARKSPGAAIAPRHAPAVHAPSVHPPLPRIGLEASFEKIIPREWTIQAYDPRLPDVLSTPAMIAMMEVAAGLAVQPELPPGAITVGTRIEVDHLKAVPAGTAVKATARLVEHKGRFMIFAVDARAGDLLIGRGRVSRAIVEPATFHAKSQTHTAP